MSRLAGSTRHQKITFNSISRLLSLLSVVSYQTLSPLAPPLVILCRAVVWANFPRLHLIRLFRTLPLCSCWMATRVQNPFAPPHPQHFPAVRAATAAVRYACLLLANIFDSTSSSPSSFSLVACSFSPGIQPASSWPGSSISKANSLSELLPLLEDLAVQPPSPQLLGDPVSLTA
jgi:hypothetical protein